MILNGSVKIFEIFVKKYLQIQLRNDLHSHNISIRTRIPTTMGSKRGKKGKNPQNNHIQD